MATALAPRPATAEDRAALVEAVRRLLADRCAEADVRRIMDSESGHDPALWRALGDLGVVGLTIPEKFGGAGLSAIELELVMEEGGAALLPSPLISTEIARHLLIGADAGDMAPGIFAVVFAGDRDWAGPNDVRVDASGTGLIGSVRFVPDSAIADTILVVVDDYVWALNQSDATVTPLPVFDRTRRLARLTFNCRAIPLGPARNVGFARDLAIVALAGEQAGGARRVLEMTVEYARTRHQFGRAIGSFQAIKHMAADLLLEVESATSAARDAARQLAEDSPGKDAAIALAGFTCADAFVRVTKDAVQMHGGIAFTWDHPAHLYLRRARSAAQLYGDPAHWRERYLCALEEAA